MDMTLHFHPIECRSCPLCLLCPNRYGSLLYASCILLDRIIRNPFVVYVLNILDTAYISLGISFSWVNQDDMLKKGSYHFVRISADI